MSELQMPFYLYYQDLFKPMDCQSKFKWKMKKLEKKGTTSELPLGITNIAITNI